MTFFHVMNSCAHNCTGCDTKRKHRLHFPHIQRCSTGLQEGSVIFTTLKVFLRTEFEGHICQSLGSLNSQVFVCVCKGLRPREKDLNQLTHWVFFYLCILNDSHALLDCGDLRDSILSALHSLKLLLWSGEYGHSYLLITPLSLA